LGKKERIRKLIPLISRIKDEKLRASVEDVWVKAWEESGWEDVNDCPFHLQIEGVTLIQHTNFVATIALAMATFAKDTWRMSINIDLLIAGAALHDVSKLLEHAPQKGTLGKHSVIDENLVHGTYGVHLALNLRLPLGVINIMGTHTPQVGKKPKSIEGLFICYADYASADPHFLANGLPLIINTIDFKFYR